MEDTYGNDSRKEVEGVLWIIDLACLYTNGFNNANEDDVFNFCDPKNLFPNQKNLELGYDSIIEGYRLVLGEFYIAYVSLFCYLCLGAIQIAAMGDLSFNLSDTV